MTQAEILAQESISNELDEQRAKTTMITIVAVVLLTIAIIAALGWSFEAEIVEKYEQESKKIDELGFSGYGGEIIDSVYSQVATSVEDVDSKEEISVIEPVEDKMMHHGLK